MSRLELNKKGLEGDNLRMQAVILEKDAEIKVGTTTCSLIRPGYIQY